MDQCGRVLHVLAGLDRGGAETIVMNLYRNIDRTKVQFDFVVNKTEKKYQYYDEVVALGGKVYFAPRFEIKNLLTYRKWWNTFFDEHKEYIAVHGHHTVPGFIYLTSAKKHGIVAIAHSHTAGGKATLKSFSRRVLWFPLRYIADYRFACSKAAAKWMFGTSEGSIILNNAIDTKKFCFDEKIRKKKRDEFNFEGDLVLGNVGRLNSPKNQLFLLKIFSDFHKEYPESKLLLVGEGEDHERLKKEAEALEITGNVIFTGVRSDIPELLQAMDIFVFPSLYEGLPVTVVEAQASGLPCLISDTITDEVVLSDFVEVLPINKGTKVWVSAISRAASKRNKRNEGAEIVREAQYDIELTSKWLMNFYLELLCKVNERL